MAAQTCLRCGAPVEPDDTVCFECGAPIGDSKTPTQPVNVPRKGERAAPSQPEASAAAAAGAVGTARGSTTSQPLATRPLSAVSPGVRPRVGNRWLLTLLAAVVLAGIAVGAGLVARAALAGPPVARTTLYRDAAHGFSLRRPALWTLTTEADGVLLTDSDGSSTVQVRVTTANGSASDALQAIATATPGLTTVPEQPIAGQTWEQVSGQVTGADGAVHQVAIYATLHGAGLYMITCSSPLASYAATNNLVFQPLLSSFAFT